MTVDGVVHLATQGWYDPATGREVTPTSHAAFGATVTFVVTELTSTDSASTIQRHRELVDAAVVRHGGLRRTGEAPGEAMVAAFARASDAVLAASAMCRSFTDEPSPTPRAPALRAGIHTREAPRPSDDTFGGSAIARAAGICGMAHPGQILVSSATRDLAVDQLGTRVLLRDLGEHRLRDLARAERVWQLVGEDLPDDFPTIRSFDQVANNLPSNLTTFVGRGEEIAALAALVREHRLVTLTGSAGAGKSRLAQRIAAEVADDFDGVWWVELARIDDPFLVPAAIGHALGIALDPLDPIESLVARIRRSTILVVLDNCEHVVEACAATTASLLLAGPDIRVLATSRATLGVAGEVAWRIPSMATPSVASGEPLEQLRGYDAIRLFAERAVCARPNFRLDEATITDVAELCRRLDGIPLAIELAAARCKILSPARILDGLERAETVLGAGGRTSSPRQQTMEGSIDWSYSLLSPTEQLLLRRLAVFAGSFSLDAAEAVSSDDLLPAERVLELLEHLVDQSLLQVDHGRHGPRFHLLAMIRQCSRRHLVANGELEAIAERHASYFRVRAGHLWPCFTADMISIVDQAELERWDLLTALQRAAAHDSPTRLAALAIDCLPALAVRHVVDADRWYTLVDEALDDEPPALAATLLLRWIDVLLYVGDHVRGRAIVERARALATAVGDVRLLAEAQYWQAAMGSFSDPQQRRVALLAAGQACAAVGDEHDASSAKWLAAWCEFQGGDLAGAQERFDEAGRVRNECPRCQSSRLVFEARVALAAGQIERAQRLVDAARRANERLADLSTRAMIVAVESEVALLGGVLDSPARTEARRLLGQARDNGLEPFLALLVVAEGRALRAADPEAAIALLEPMIDSARGPRGERAIAAVTAAAAWHALDRCDEARSALDTAAELNARRGDPYLAGQIDLRRAWLALDRHELRLAEDLAHGVLSASVLPDRHIDQIDALELLAAAAAMNESWMEAAHLHGAVERKRATVGYHLRQEPARARIDELVRRGREALGDEVFADAARAWETLAPEDLVPLVRRSRGERGRPSWGWDALTPTEERVGALAAEGLSNREIGGRLLMGGETVKTHLGRVYRKLDVRNRVELAAAYALRSRSHT